MIEIKQFILKILTFSIILIAIAVILYLTLLRKFYVKSFPLQILLIGFLTAFSHIRMIKASQHNIRRFTSAFMLSVTLKLLIYLFFLLIGLLFDHSNALTFVITFFILYICYTVFEVSQILKFLKK